jgi:gliding motility-associated protein GldM
MAGGKLSPRQKMINMMYLVLTALLALNVSAEILESFQNIADSLRQSANKYSEKNSSLSNDISKAIEKEVKDGNVKNQKFLAQLNEIGTRVAREMVFLDSLRNQMFEDKVAGKMEEFIDEKDPAKWRLRKPDETEKNYRFWMIGEGGADTDNEGRGSGAAIVLKKRLDDFIDWSNVWYKANSSDAGDKTFDPIAMDPEFNDLITNPETKSKKWEYYTFHGAPAIANVAILEKLKNDIQVVYAKMLENVKSQLNEVTFDFDTIQAIAIPDATTAVPGQRITVKLQIGSFSTQSKPQFGGGAVAKGDGSYGELTFLASGNVIPADKGQGTQNYAAEIRVRKVDGTFSVLPVKGSITVLKPEIFVKSRSVQQMYLLCANDIEVRCFTLENANNYNPRFEIQGGQLIQSPQQPSAIRVIPNAAKVGIKVKSLIGSDAMTIGDLVYNVVKPPKPTFKIKTSQGYYSPGKLVSGKDQITLELHSDEKFAQDLPADARYQFYNVELKAKIGFSNQSLRKFQASSVGKIAQMQINLGTILNEVYKPGMTVFLLIEEASRINFQNNKVKEGFEPLELSFALEIQ